MSLFDGIPIDPKPARGRSVSRQVYERLLILWQQSPQMFACEASLIAHALDEDPEHLMEACEAVCNTTITAMRMRGCTVDYKFAHDQAVKEFHRHSDEDKIRAVVL